MTPKRIFLTLAAITLAALALLLIPRPRKPTPPPPAGFTLTWYHGAETCGPCLAFQESAGRVRVDQPRWHFRAVDLSKDPDFARRMGLLAQTGLLLEFRGEGAKHRAEDLVGLWDHVADPAALDRSLRSNMARFESARR